MPSLGAFMQEEIDELQADLDQARADLAAARKELGEARLLIREAHAMLVDLWVLAGPALPDDDTHKSIDKTVSGLAAWLSDYDRRHAPTTEAEGGTPADNKETT